MRRCKKQRIYHNHSTANKVKTVNLKHQFVYKSQLCLSFLGTLAIPSYSTLQLNFLKNYFSLFLALFLSPGDEWATSGQSIHLIFLFSFCRRRHSSPRAVQTNVLPILFFRLLLLLPKLEARPKHCCCCCCCCCCCIISLVLLFFSSWLASEIERDREGESELRSQERSMN